MLILQLLILLDLALIFVQDLIDRSVYWILFPGLFLLFLGLRLSRHQSIAVMWQPFMVNVLFFAMVLFILSGYFSLKNGRWINVIGGLMGWGDILIMLSMTLYLSVLNFLFFYIISLMAVLLTWIIWQAISKRKNKQVPLAGLQAFFFAIILSADWWLKPFNLTNDAWLINLMTTWI